MSRAAAKRWLLFLGGLLVFVLALELLKKGAGGLRDLLTTLGVEGTRGAVGFGWLMACVVLSGSPVAAISLALLGGGALDVHGSFAMIAGSRLGASFVVLLIGAIDDFRARRSEMRSAYVGVAALLVTASVYVPALFVGFEALDRGLFAGIRVEGRGLANAIDAIYGPVTRAVVEVLPRFLVFVAGVLTLLGALRIFDRALPELDPDRAPTGLAAGGVYRPWVMFAIGLAVTSITLSVAVSISILVPLAAKGYVRRENLFPYILGANITTFIDTLFFGAFVGHPEAVRIVAVMMATVTALSIPIVFGFPYAYARIVDRAARGATATRGRLALFVGFVVGIPALLLFL